MKKFIHIANKIYNTPWFVKPATLDTISQQFINHIKGELPMDTSNDMDEAENIPNLEKGIAVITIEGVIGHRLSLMETMCGGIDVNSVREQILNALEEPSVTAILLDINSPGGTVTGVPEFAEFIAEANKVKKIYAYVDSLCASAAMYIASQCEAIFCTQSSELGSVGVYMLTVDESRALDNAGIKVNAITNAEATMKLAGASFKPLTDDEKEMFQKGVQKSYDQFKAAVLSKRTIDPQYLNGECFDGEDSVKLGFADGLVSNMDQALSIISNQ